jgi:hypothetical protein
MNKELFDAIKKEGLFATTVRLGRERRAALPTDISGLYDRNLTNGSKRIAGTCVSEQNKIERIPNSIEVRGEKPVKLLAPVTVDAQELDEPETESTDDMPVELSLIEPLPGEPTESEEEPVETDSEGA